MLQDGLTHLTMMSAIPLKMIKNKRVSGLFKDELGRKIIAEVVALRSKTWAYLMDDGSDKRNA